MTGRSSLNYFFFTPNSVAVIGPTDRTGSVGRTVVANLLQGMFRGKVHAVNPSRKEVLGLRCYPKITTASALDPRNGRSYSGDRRA